jgi:signal recognition particle receptor subunit beta
MAQASGADERIVDARIVYWGIEGAGTSTNLQIIHAKLRPDHRGRLEHVPTRLDPSVSYERLPIELGEIAGVRTRIQIVAVPGGAEHAPTRKALLDRVDGLVFVVDARRERIDANVAALEELRSALSAYGRSLEDVPLVVQYNKQDLSDAFVLEELHRKLDVRGAAAFEAVAAEGSGVLQTLTTISKRVVRTLRESREAAATTAPAVPPARPPAARLAPAPPRPAAPLRPPPAPAPRLPDLEEAALSASDELDDRDAAVSRAAGLLDASWPDVASGYPLETDDGISAPGPLDRDPLAGTSHFGLEVTAPHGAPPGDWRIVAAGAAEPRGPRSLVVPLVLADEEGRELRLRLSLALELLPED